MGLWQTGYMEFHDTQGVDWGEFVPRLITYPCMICGKDFESKDELFDHRFEQHPFKRPILFFNGLEATSPTQLLVHPLAPETIDFGATTRCFLNGSIIEKSDLISHLAGKRRGMCSIVLANEEIESSYQIDFDVPNESDLKEVERIFFEVAGTDILNLDRIDLFINMSSSFQTAIRYVDGMSNYLYGILAKDQRGGTQLQRSDFISKFNQALDTLQHFERPLAFAIVGVVNFNQNFFEKVDLLSKVPKIYLAMRKFNGLVTGDTNTGGNVALPNLVSSKNIPLDYATEKIFEWALMPSEELYKLRKELEHLANSTELVTNDRFKIQMLLAELLVEHREYSAAIRVAGRYSNDSVFGTWAQRIIGAKE